MASSSSDFTSGEITAPPTRQRRPLMMLVPLIYAPILPLIRIGLRHKPVLRERMFFGVLACAFAHGAYIVTDLYDIESK